MERQLTHEPSHHDLDNNDNFSADDSSIVYDGRDGETGIAGNAVIARVRVETGEIQVIYREPRAGPWGPGVGAANCNPIDGTVSFIRGPDSASQEIKYEQWRRSGVSVDPQNPGVLRHLDARDVIPPFTAGALRGGTHRHEWSHDGKWIGFTYNDALLADLERRSGAKVNLRTIGVATRLGAPVRVRPGIENHDGEFFSAVVVRVTPDPRPGSDDISRAFEDAWVGRDGYQKTDGTRQRTARAFLGTVRTADGRDLTEVFIVDIPERIDVPGDGPLEGTAHSMPSTPSGATQRRLTFTADRKYPGVSLQPRHWVRSSPDGTRIAFLAQDDDGTVQAFIVGPEGGRTLQVTREATSIQSCVRWSPDGGHLLYVCGGAVTVCDAGIGSSGFAQSSAVTIPSDPIPENCVWSNGGRSIAFNRMVQSGENAWKQIFLIGPPRI